MPIAIFSDVHGNLPALEAVLADIAPFGCDALYCLGDVINGVDPQGCADLLRPLPNLTCIRGNAEMYFLTSDLESFPLDQTPEEMSEILRLMRWYADHLTPDTQDWLSTWSEMVQADGLALMHDSPMDRLMVERKIFPGVDPKYYEFIYHAPGISLSGSAEEWHLLNAWMERAGCKAVFVGHTHEPFVVVQDGRTVCNVGSVGMPLDGDPRACWVLLENPSDDHPQITLRRVQYNLDKTLAVIDKVDDYPSFEIPGRKRAYRWSFPNAQHWRLCPPSTP